MIPLSNNTVSESKSKTITKIVGVVFALVLLGGLGMFYFINHQNKQNISSPSPQVSPLTPTQSPTLYSQCSREQSFTSIRKSLENPEQVCQLVVYFEPVAMLVDNIDKFTNLKILAISGQKLTSVPTELVRLRSLEALILTNNSLRHFPTELLNFPNLKSLRLEGNKIPELEKQSIQRALPKTKVIF